MRSEPQAVLPAIYRRSLPDSNQPPPSHHSVPEQPIANRGIAVGTLLTRRPPLRSVRAR